MVSVIAILSLFTVFNYLRSQAQSKIYSSFSHTWLNSPRPWLIYRAGALPEGTEITAQLGQNISDWSSKGWVIGFDAPMRSTRPVNDYGKEVLQLIRSIVQRYPQSYFVFNFDRHSPYLKEEIAKSWVDIEESQNFALSSREDGLIRELRQDHPAWAFVMGESTTTQIFMLASLLLEPLAKLKGDILRLPASMLREGQVNQRLLIEVHRQKKFVLVDLPPSAEQAQFWLSQGVDAISSDRTDLLEQIKTQPHKPAQETLKNK